MSYNKVRIFLFLFTLVVSPTISNAKVKVSGEHYGSLFLNKTDSYSDLDSNTIDSDNEVSDIFLDFNAQYRIAFKEYFDITTSWWLLNVKNADAGEDRVFDDEGLVLDQLFMRFHDEQAEFYIGKFNPLFGIGWNRKIDASMWSNDFADEYKIVGKLGLGIKAKFDLDEYGQHALDLATFFADDSNLNDAALTNRDLRSGNAGQAADTSGFSSYIINIQGENVAHLPHFFYNISYRSLDAGNVTFIDDEKGYSFATGFAKPILGDLKLKPFIEYAKISNFNSTNNRFGVEFGDDNLPGDYEYITFVLSLAYHGWSFYYVNMFKDIKTSSGNYDVDQEEFSFAYQIFDNLRIAIGQKTEDHSNGVKLDASAIDFTFTHEF